MSVEVVAQHDEQLGAYVIRFKYGKYNWPQVKGVIDIIKVLIPASDREYNPASKEWTILDGSWTILKDIIGRANFRIKEEKVLRTDNFHYDYSTPTETVVSKETLAAQLATLLEIQVKDLEDSILAKKAYRKKALLLHPDRNNGDGSKMSELNAIWSQYNA